MKNVENSRKDPAAARRQLEYAVYMMTASLFRAAPCTAPLTEEKLRLAWRELVPERQEALEKAVLETLEQRTVPAMGLRDAAAVRTKIRFGRIAGTDRHFLLFFAEGKIFFLLPEQEKGQVRILLLTYDVKARRLGATQ